jgi:hypothetical protein
MMELVMSNAMSQNLTAFDVRRWDWSVFTEVKPRKKVFLLPSPISISAAWQMPFGPGSSQNKFS